jgi:UDP-N-acetylglucosamine 4-epimerase
MYNTQYHYGNLENTSVLITGAAGFIGSNLVEYLLKYGVKKIVVLDNLSTGFMSNIEPFLSNPRFTFIKGDLTNLDDCMKACEGVDLICHQAALGSVPRSVKEPHNTCASNIQGFVNLVVAARDSGIKRIVYASSSSVYGDEPTLPKKEERIGKPLSPYAISKLSNEIFAKNFGELYGIDFIGFRYFNVFGPNQSPQGAYAAVIPLYIDACLKNEPCYFNGDGLMTRDFTFVENVVQINVRALTTTNPEALNQVYNVGCNERITIMDLYTNIRDITNSKSEGVHREPREGDIRNSLADISKAQQLLDYDPVFKLKEGLSITIDTFVK